jgi:hypothetical protein
MERIRTLFAALIIFAAGVVYGEQVGYALRGAPEITVGWYRGWDACSEMHKTPINRTPP